MNIFFSIYTLIAFFVLTPGIFIRVPSKGSNAIVALVHGLIFVAILAIFVNYAGNFGNPIFEGAKSIKKTVSKKNIPTKKVSKKNTAPK